MLVVVGPVSTESAKAWLGHARGVLEGLGTAALGDCPASPDLLEVFDEYLTEWERVASTGDPFCWNTEIPVEQAVYHMHAFHQVADMLARTSGREPPPAGADFVLALLTGVLSALESDSPSSAAFAQHLGQFWPGRSLSLR